MMIHIGTYAGIPITLEDTEVNRAIRDLVASQQDEILRLKGNDFADIMGRLKEMEAADEIQRSSRKIWKYVD